MYDRNRLIVTYGKVERCKVDDADLAYGFGMTMSLSSYRKVFVSVAAK